MKKLSSSYSRKELLIVAVLFLAMVTGLFLISKLPFFAGLNESFLDYLRKGIKPRNEIVVIKIDDKSLAEIGAWPWTRDKYAEAIAILDNNGTKAIAFDVLFLEKRDGDSEFVTALKSVNTPIILAGTFSDGKFISPIFGPTKGGYAYTNIVPDSDGKVRKTQIGIITPENKCITSFAYTTYMLYRYGSSQPVLCPEKNLVSFNYASNNFTEYSFSDLIAGKLNEAQLKDKIILIGATASGLNNDLGDVFVGIDGNKVAGINIQANIINSFLSDKFQSPPNDLINFLLGFAAAVLVFLVINFRKRSLLEYLLTFGALIIINLFGIIIYDFGISFPFLLVNILGLGGYFFKITYRYFAKSRENAFVKKAFSQYVNPVILSKILTDPSLLNLGGEKKEVTIMFTDIRGFTSISEKADPHTLFALVNDYLTVMSNIIMEQGGTIDKYIGDAIMAFWNAPLENAYSNLNSLTTAVAMVDALKEFNRSILKDEKYTQLKEVLKNGLQIGIGVHAGPAIVGNLGSEKRFNYTVIGDSVNIASRLEMLTKYYKAGVIASGEVIADISSEHFSMRLIDEVVVKGKAEPIKIYEVAKKTAEAESLNKVFAKAFNFYSNGKLPEALKLFKSLGYDGPSKLFVSRIEGGKVDLDNKGIWYWDEK